ncbi:MAG: hypothetical protein K6U08_08435 [Firmicutes bacterium]|nr:hypothetical protein [Bacillota bacterium]
MGVRGGTKVRGSVSFPVLAAVYIGTVVGAGFASGQEILQFFSAHGVWGLGALVTATASLGLFGYLLLRAGARVGAESHAEVIDHVAGPVLGRVIDYILTFFLFGGTAAMLAGAGATLQQEYGLPYWVGLTGMAVATVATVLAGIGGVVKSVSAIVPFLLAALAAVAAATLSRSSPDFGFVSPARAAVGDWFVSGLAYGSYNLILATSVLAPVARLVRREDLGRGAALGAAGLGLGALAVYLTILCRTPASARVEVPMVLAARLLSPVAGLAYGAVLLAEVYTTAVGSLYGLANRLVGEGSPYFRTVVIGGAAAATVAGAAGFSTIVGTLYPAVGYAGFLLLGTLALAWLRGRL